jgi:predicted TIM-barrel fold metal-dependent hydrolase
MSDLRPDHPIHDADNHYYEALDAFTRHLDPGLGPRCVEWCEIDGRKYQVLGGRVSHAVTNPTFDPVAGPGVLAAYFRGNEEGLNPLEVLRDSKAPIHPSYRNRDERLKVLDEQGLHACWMFPTLGMVYETPLRDDPFAVCKTFEAFNRYLEEDWGWAYQERIFTAPYLTLADPEWAAKEVTWAIEGGARTIVMLPAAPITDTGPRNPFDPSYDPVWSQIDEAGLTVVVHAGDSGLSSQGYEADGFSASFKGGGYGPSVKFFNIEQAIHLWLFNLMCQNVPKRFPNIRFASVENGAEFLPDLFRKLRSIERRMPGVYSDDPVELFKQQVWINPFWEDDVHEVVDLMGADRVLFGSDWPHIEGMPSPLDYLVELKELSPEDQRRITWDNVQELSHRRPR